MPDCAAGPHRETEGTGDTVRNDLIGACSKGDVVPKNSLRPGLILGGPSTCRSALRNRGVAYRICAAHVNHENASAAGKSDSPIRCEAIWSQLKNREDLPAGVNRAGMLLRKTVSVLAKRALGSLTEFNARCAQRFNGRHVLRASPAHRRHLLGGIVENARQILASADK